MINLNISFVYLLYFSIFNEIFFYINKDNNTYLYKNVERKKNISDNKLL